jgi:N6-adenosine-specific RNA methylase IME4/DNA-binding XRE family transcriptional regulator
VEAKPEPKPWPLLTELLPPLSSQERSELYENIKRNGMQYPIKILPSGKIFDGHTRFDLFGKKARFEVVNVSEEKALELGLGLNLNRRHLSHEQRNEIIRELRRRGYTQQKTAALVGISRSAVDHVENVNKLRNDNNVNAKDAPDLRVIVPKQYYAIIWRRAKTSNEPYRQIGADYKVSPGRVAQIVKSYEKTLDRKRALEELNNRASMLPPLQAEFSTIVVDPPWPLGNAYDPENFRGSPPYPELSLEKIRELRIPAAKDCVLWLWTTNHHLHEAFHTVESWGFEYKILLTWAKSNNFGLGKYLRGQTEHCLAAVKGHPVWKLTNQSTLLLAPSREHSRKPDEFYKLVESLSEAPRLDYFGRESRPGWTVYGTSVEQVRTV